MAGIVALLCSLTSAPPLGAETIYVDANGEHGQGWLFGARSDGNCWIALPWHVVARLPSDPVHPVFYTDQKGRSGETDLPVHVTEVPGAQQAAGGADDLGFARIVAGRENGNCSSRLGLPPLAYVEALRNPQDLVLTIAQKRSTLKVDVKLLRSLADEFGGSTLLVRAARDTDAENFMGGASGAVVQGNWNGHLYPLAMGLSVPRGTQNLRALRFDRIADAFAVVQAAQRPAEAPEPTRQTPVAKITGIEATVTEGSTPLNQLVTTTGCWRGAPAQGKRYVEFSVFVADPGYITEIHLQAAPDCGPAAKAIIEERRPGETSWRTLALNCPTAPTGGTGCRIARSAPREFRLHISSPAGWVGLSALRIN